MTEDNHKHYWPKITVDSQKGREWLHPDPPTYYLYKDDDGMWSVIDRNWDMSVTRKYKRKHDCVRGFYAAHKAKGKEFDRIINNLFQSRC